MKNKKLAILAAICLVTATTAVATGCKKKPVTVDPVYEVTLNVPIAAIILNFGNIFYLRKS